MSTWEINRLLPRIFRSSLKEIDLTSGGGNKSKIQGTGYGVKYGILSYALYICTAVGATQRRDVIKERNSVQLRSEREKRALNLRSRF